MAEKTLAEKMFLKNARSMAVLNGAAHPAVVAQMPAPLIDAGKGKVDVVLMFAPNQAELEQLLPLAQERLAEKGALWIAYLKKTASIKTDIHRDIIGSYASLHGLETVSIIALDGNWSALRLKSV